MEENQNKNTEFELDELDEGYVPKESTKQTDNTISMAASNEPAPKRGWSKRDIKITVVVAAIIALIIFVVPIIFDLISLYSQADNSSVASAITSTSEYSE